MREIKFRGWDEKNKEMVYRINLLFSNLLNDCFEEYEECGLKIMQYTGLKDKNGKEIYEGDVVLAWDKYKYIVKYSEDRGGWYPFATDDGCGCCAEEVANEKCSEIIGNIHENPELLEVQP